MNGYNKISVPATNTETAHRLDGRAVEKVDKDTELLYDLVDLTKIFKVSKRTIFNWRANNLLPIFELGGKIYISRDKLLAFIADKEGVVL